MQKGRISRGLSNEYGQYALDNSIPFKDGKIRVAYNGEEIIQLMSNGTGVNAGLYHGFYTDWHDIGGSELRNFVEHKLI